MNKTLTTLNAGAPLPRVGELRKLRFRGGFMDGGAAWVTGGKLEMVSRRERDLVTGPPIEWHCYEEQRGEMVLVATRSGQQQGTVTAPTSSPAP